MISGKDFIGTDTCSEAPPFRKRQVQSVFPRREGLEPAPVGSALIVAVEVPERQMEERAWNSPSLSRAEANGRPLV